MGGLRRRACLIESCPVRPNWKGLLLRRLALGLALTLFTLHSPSEAPKAPSVARPNIVLILTDDQRADSLALMPKVTSQLVRKGVAFSNAFAVNPICCPSRATILTGRHSHGTGVYRNGSPHGGFASFDDSSTIATWLNDSGYRTALVGKYMNGYASEYVPPGWDSWRAYVDTPGYYGYTLNVDGKLVSYGDANADYSTDVLANYATSFIQKAPPGLPLFLAFTPYAPHEPSTPAARHLSAFAGLRPHRPPSFDEVGVGDKPGYIRSLPRLSPTREAELDELRKDHYRSLLAVDEAVGRILGALAQAGRLSNTLVLYSSDNGFLFGEHRWTDKAVPYEESIRVPMVLRYDPITQGRAGNRSELALNLDVAPTFASAAGAAAPGAEGTSLLPLVGGTSSEWRTGFLIEMLRSRNGLAIPVSYCALRTERYIYVLYDTGEQELYDLALDPFQLKNRALEPAYAATLLTLSSELRQQCVLPPSDA